MKYLKAFAGFLTVLAGCAISYKLAGGQGLGATCGALVGMSLMYSADDSK